MGVFTWCDSDNNFISELDAWISIGVFTRKTIFSLSHECAFCQLITVPKRSCGKVMFSQVCVQNSVHGGRGVHPLGRQPSGRHPLLGRHPLPRTDSYCSGRYASYWNAFLFLLLTFHVKLLGGWWIFKQSKITGTEKSLLRFQIGLSPKIDQHSILL